jgi:hypothetical protein
MAYTKYREEYNEQAYKLALLGCTDIEMAEYFQVCEATFHNWKIDFPSFLESVNRGKVIADANVASKLYDRATGAEWIEQQAFKVKRGSNNEEVQIVNVKRAAPPDTQAASLWLRNRRSKPGKNSQGWNEKVINEMTGLDGGAIATRDVTKEALKLIPTDKLEQLLVTENPADISSECDKTEG